MHPYVIDTSVCFSPSLHNSQKPSLRRLAVQVLGCVVDITSEASLSFNR